MFRSNFTKTDRLSMILAEMIVIRLHTDYGWKVCYESRTTCEVFRSNSSTIAG